MTSRPALAGGERLTLVDAGVLDYDAAHVLQRGLIEARVAARAAPTPQQASRGEETLSLQDDVLLLVEHPPVYTLGRNADVANVLWDAAELRERGIAVRQAERGGEVTYHGPGQLVGYPIVDLRRRGLGAADYVGKLEAMLVSALTEFGIASRPDAVNRGVWIGDDKVAALGVRITRGLSMHGFALNVCVKLEDYAGIVPCGIRDRGVVSMDRLVPGVTLASVKPAVVSAFQQEFGYARVVSPTYAAWHAAMFD